MDPFTPLFGVLRSGREHVKIAIECSLGAPSPPTTQSIDSAVRAPAATATTSTSNDDRDSDEEVRRRQQKHIIALVTNVEQGYEQCCLFVLQRRRNDPEHARIVDGLPLLPGFRSSIRQVAHADGTTSGLQIDMALADKTISAGSDDAQAVRDLLDVLREAASAAKERAKDAEEEEEEASHLFAWVEHYMHVERSALPSAAAARATPIFSRFTSSAFAPGSRPAPVRPYARVGRSRSAGTDEVKVSIGTFNVSGQMPDSQIDLRDWLRVGEDEPDVLLIGIEEADSSGLSYVVWTPHVEAAWSDAVERAMRTRSGGKDEGLGDEYVKLTSKQLVGVLVMVYVRRGVLPRITDPAVASVGIGFGGWAANKGAAAIRMAIDGTTTCFVVAHLSAFHTPEARQRRRWDYHEIVRRLNFVFLSSSSEASNDALHETAAHHHRTVRERETQAVSMLRAQLERSSRMSVEVAAHSGDRGTAESSSSSEEEDETQRWTIMQHDVVFWAGDLNFRIDLGTAEVKRLIIKRQFEQALLKFDQLRSEMTAKASFAGFQEQEIDFAPTYKFDRGTDVYDTSEKQRCPAWTDRVLWYEKDVHGTQVSADSKTDDDKASPRTSRVQPLSYESAPTITLSDHRPVLASFLLRVKPPEKEEKH